MEPDMTDLALETRDGLPDALRVLLADYPREGWESDPGLDGLTRFWLERHMMFRKLLSEIREGTEALIDRKMEPERYAIMTSRYGEMLINGLHEHHTIEDTHFFPKLIGVDARITRGFDILDQDHHTIDDFLNGLVDSANTIIRQVDDRDKLQNAAGAFGTHLTKLEHLLNRHLTDEEELIVPVILRYGADVLS